MLTSNMKMMSPRSSLMSLNSFYIVALFILVISWGECIPLKVIWKNHGRKPISLIFHTHKENQSILLTSGMESYEKDITLDYLGRLQWVRVTWDNTNELTSWINHMCLEDPENIVIDLCTRQDSIINVKSIPFTAVWKNHSRIPKSLTLHLDNDKDHQILLSPSMEFYQEEFEYSFLKSLLWVRIVWDDGFEQTRWATLEDTENAKTQGFTMDLSPAQNMML